MRIPALVALGALAYGAFLAATIPASVVAARVQDESRGRVAIEDAQGTAWHGHARVAVATPGGRVAFERVAWDFVPGALLAGALAFDVVATAPGIEARAGIARTFTRWEARALDVRASAAAIVAAVPWLGAWRPEGEIVARAPQLSTDGADLQGEARLEWRGAAIAMSDVRPLGTYRATIRGQGTAARLDLSTVEGPLQVAGHGTLTLPARLAFAGEARATGPRAADLAPLLDLLGPRRPDGARTLRWPR